MRTSSWVDSYSTNDYIPGVKPMSSMLNLLRFHSPAFRSSMIPPNYPESTQIPFMQIATGSIDRTYWISLFPHWSAQFPGDIFFQGNAPNQVALTFDNGPDPALTPLVLDILSQYGVKGTFMCLGKRIGEHPLVVQRIIKEGHIIANHTWDHPDLTKLPLDEAKKQILSTERKIHQQTGLRTRLFRPPFGAMNPRIVSELLAMDYKIILWSQDSLDWAGLTGPQVVANIIVPVKPGSIILFHDDSFGKIESRLGTVQALPYAIETLRAMGYRFVTIPRLLNIPAYAR